MTSRRWTWLGSTCRFAGRVGLAVAVLVECSCGGSGFVANSPGLNGNGVASSPTSHPTVALPSVCGVYLSDGDARIFMTNASACPPLARDISAGGVYWTLQEHQPEAQLGMVCMMTRSEVQAAVVDSGGTVYGRNACAAMLSAGWREDTDAEDAFSAAAASREAAELDQASQEQAAAAAQAAGRAAATAKNDRKTREQQAAASALNDLNDALREVADAVKVVSSDVAQVHTDLLATRSEAATGQGDYCSNLTTVSSDASVTVNSDVTVTLDSTIHSSLQPALDHVRSARSDLAAALTALGSDGVASPTGAQSTLLAAPVTLKKGVAKVNHLIDQANADLIAASALANSLATGDCVSDGPGTAPAAEPYVR